MDDVLTAFQKNMQVVSIAACIQAKDVLSMDEAALFLGISYSTLRQRYKQWGIAYSLVNRHVYFLKKDLEEYAMKNRTQSRTEIEEQADSYVNRKKKFR